MVSVTKFGGTRVGKTPVTIEIELTEEELTIQQQSISDKLNVTNRSLRDELLSSSDWTQGADSPLSDADKALWSTYRTQLRDITTHENWPDLHPEDWPTKPS